jgi:hypothetical protein
VLGPTLIWGSRVRGRTASCSEYLQTCHENQVAMRFYNSTTLDGRLFVLFLAAATLLAVTPGPGIFYVLSRTLAGGRTEGFLSAAGTFVGGLVHVVAAALGLSAIIGRCNDRAGYVCGDRRVKVKAGVLTDPPPRKNRSRYLESDRIKTLDLPQNGDLVAIAKRFETAMKEDSVADVRATCAKFLAIASDFYRVPNCGIRVLAARPLRVREEWSSELFGDYHPDTMLIRVWMRTAVRKEVTSFGTFLSTLCHEFCHHLDFQTFRFADSWHARCFYERAAVLYHHARDTAPKKLVWVPMSRGRWRINWWRLTALVLSVNKLLVLDELGNFAHAKVTDRGGFPNRRRNLLAGRFAL